MLNILTHDNITGDWGDISDQEGAHITCHHLSLESRPQCHCTIGTQADTTRMLSRDLIYLVFPDGARSLSQGKLGKIYVKNPIDLVKKAENVHKSAYFSS